MIATIVVVVVVINIIIITSTTISIIVVIVVITIIMSTHFQSHDVDYDEMVTSRHFPQSDDDDDYYCGNVFVIRDTSLCIIMNTHHP